MSLESKFMFINGKKANFIFGGNGEPVVLIRGWPRNCRENDKILMELSKHFQIFGLNLPGFGNSERLERLSIEDYVVFIDAFSKKLKIPQFHLIGFSYGGMLSLKYASVHPDKLKKLIIVAPPFYTDMLPLRARSAKVIIWLYKKFSFINDLFNYIIRNNRIFPVFYKCISGYDTNNPGQKQDYEYTIEDLRRIKTSDCIEIVDNVMNLDLRKSCQKIEARTLILVGSKDRMISEKSGEELSKLIENSTLIKVDAEHWNLVETISEEKLIEFLKD
ncbi:MAG: alpha/beta hydrolase [Candidatus Aenigmarchaeota archaeon]|nr:alpha/beta hydrolase [Candidatus Aenigmarchaeota archaeon]